MKHTDVIEKIKKLLAVAEGADDHEAHTAMAIAKRLLSQYNLSLRDVEGRPLNHKNGKPEFFGTLIHLKNGHTVFQYWIANLLKDHFYVYVTQSTDNVTKQVHFKILGEHHNVEIAWYVYHSLERQFAQLWVNHQAKTKSPLAEYNSFVAGLYYGLDVILQNEKNQLAGNKSLALLSSELLEYGMSISSIVNESLGLGDLGTKLYNRETIDAGRAASKDINIFSAIPKGSSNLKKIA